MKYQILFAFALLSITGCQTVPYQGKARNVSLKPRKQGIISIPTEYRDEDRAKAQTLMSKNCAPLAPEVQSEGEVAVGTTTNSKQKTSNRNSTETQVGSLFGLPLVSGDAGGTDASTSSTTMQVKEWHISYKCQKKLSKSM